MDFDRWLKVFKSQKELEDRYFPKKSRKLINTGNKPVIVLFTADWHIGSKYVDHEKLFLDLKSLTEYSVDDVRIITVGDLCDNFPVSFPSAEPVHGFISPQLQEELLSELLQLVGPYIDGSTWGNHEAFSERLVGYSNVSKILSKITTFFNGKGTIEYVVGKQKYRIHVSHIFRGSSMYHDLHCNIRAWMETHADIVVSAHTHTPAYLGDFRGIDGEGNPQERHLIKVGSYKGGDTFSSRYFKSGIIGNNCVVLYPDRHKITHFFTLEEAIQFLGLKKKSKSVKKK